MFGKTFKILSALFGQYEITEAEMERIYELTYKYQMLKQELSMGDFGLPQPLEDRAYIEFHRVSQELERALDKTYEAIVDTYDSWIDGHLPDDTEFENMAYRRIRELHLGDSSIEESLERTLGDDKSAIVDFLQDFLDDTFDELSEYDKFKYAGKDYKEYSRYTDLLEEKRKEDVEYYKTPSDERLDEYEERIKYLDKFSKRMAQMIQRQMPFMEEEWAEPEEEGTIELPTIFDLSYDQLITFIEEEDLEDEVKDKIMEDFGSEMVEQEMEYLKEEYLDGTALGSAIEMKERYEENYPKADLDEKILLFQEALTNMHNNGEMAEYILESNDAIEFLHDLSGGQGLEEWNKELTKTLGYPPGSRLAPKQEWFSSAMKRISKVLEILKKACH